MDARSRLPAHLVEQARAFATGERVPAAAADAATVVLLRDAAGGPEAYLLRRHQSMAFAPGMYVFPGGRVDPRDSDQRLAWSGPPVSQWALRLGCDAPRAQALVCAAARELFEESGILLAGPDAGSVVDDTTGEELEADRRALVGRALAFADFLTNRGLVLRTDLMVAWGHWVTPIFEPRRYDTRFFAAMLPAGQRARDVSGEADRVTWMRPAAACAAVDAGDIAMLPPTYVTLSEMARRGSVEEILSSAAARTVSPIEPGVDFVGDEAFLTMPDSLGPDYAGPDLL
jgi:8-oxo-dGTP pyrophosphatase MutT (NUDIX family)